MDDVGHSLITVEVGVRGLEHPFYRALQGAVDNIGQPQGRFDLAADPGADVKGLGADLEVAELHQRGVYVGPKGQVQRQQAVALGEIRLLERLGDLLLEGTYLSLDLSDILLQLLEGLARLGDHLLGELRLLET